MDMLPKIHSTQCVGVEGLQENTIIWFLPSVSLPLVFEFVWGLETGAVTLPTHQRGRSCVPISKSLFWSSPHTALRWMLGMHWLVQAGDICWMDKHPQDVSGRDRSSSRGSCDFHSHCHDAALACWVAHEEIAGICVLKQQRLFRLELMCSTTF